MARRPKPNPATRHIVSINDLRKVEIEAIFELAALYLKEQPDINFPHRIGRSTDFASNFILASLFYEPSTRTRLSFESAMLRLGGKVITSADPTTSSAAKGETLADTVRVIANYADIIVLRHPRDGAARLAAEYSHIPVVNGGDGSHEHPTQTLCDIFTLKQKGRSRKKLNVAISGDLRGSRTIHSFVYGLAQFGADITLMPAKGMELPEHVDARLREEFGYVPAPKSSFENDEPSVDAFYITPDEPHQLSFITGGNFDANIYRIREKLGKIDVVYVTRFQKERWADKEHSYPKIDAKFLEAPKYSKTSVLHPLPRVGELDVSFDSDKRAVYFKQASYGVPVRMALISLLLNLRKNRSLQKFSDGFAKSVYPIYSRPIQVGIQCANTNCIVHDSHENRHAENKFFVVDSHNSQEMRVRCLYCETDIGGKHAEDFATADTKKGYFVKGIKSLKGLSDDKMKDITIFKTTFDAVKAGFSPKERESSGLLTQARSVI
jgi:aspartate carbamoyltransferase catalytic subunit